MDDERPRACSTELHVRRLRVSSLPPGWRVPVGRPVMPSRCVIPRLVDVKVDPRGKGRERTSLNAIGLGMYRSTSPRSDRAASRDGPHMSSRFPRDQLLRSAIWPAASRRSMVVWPVAFVRVFEATDLGSSLTRFA